MLSGCRNICSGLHVNSKRKREPWEFQGGGPGICCRSGRPDPLSAAGAVAVGGKQRREAAGQGRAVLMSLAGPQQP